MSRGPTPTRTAELIDPATVMRIKSMELRAKVVVEGFWKGLHRSPFHGFSVEFTEYRQYSPGDDPRYLDWRLYARSDRYYIKKYEDETNLRCWFCVDQSRSMQYGSGEYTKARYAATLGATLGYFLYSQGDAVGLATFAEALEEVIPPRNRPGHLRRLMVGLETEAVGRQTRFDTPLEQLAQAITRRGVVVLISDMLGSLDDLDKRLGYFRATGQQVVLFHVLDPTEIDLNLEQAAVYEDMETGKTMYVDPDAARRDYRAGMDRHLETVEAACRVHGVDYHRLTTDRPFELAIMEFMQRQTQRQAGAAQRRSPVRSGA